MEQFHFDLAASRDAGGTRALALVGVVASGNLEVMVQRGAEPGRCTIEVNTAATGFRDLWEAVIADAVARRALGGLTIAIDDGGARPDTVSLRLAQAVRQIEESES